MKLKGLGVLLTFMLVVNSVCIPAATGMAEGRIATSTDLEEVQSTEAPESTEVPENTETADPTMTAEPTESPEPTETPVPLALQSLTVEKSVYAPGEAVIWNVACEGAESIAYEIRNRQGEVVQSGELDENASVLFQTESCNTYTITVTAAAGEESQSQASTVFVTNNDLTVTLTTDMLYAVVNESALACQAEIQGGIAPYTAAVKIYVDGSVVYEESMADQEAGSIDVVYMPTLFGAHAVSVVVTDAAGMTMEATVELPVAIREPETEADWKSSVSGAARTGDWRKDLVAVARTQVGYQESVRDFIMDEAGKIHGYTRYGAWHGSAYDEWSTLFVSFCLKYANISTTYFPQAANCGGLASALRNKGLYMTAQDSYEPQAGDLIFLSLGGGSVGIVDSVSGETLRVIMVNTEKTVGYTNYSKHDGSIIGYGSMEAAMRNAGLLEEETPEETDASESADPTMTAEPTESPEPTETPVPLALQSLTVEKNVYAPGEAVIWNVACEGAESIAYEIRNRQGEVVQSGELDENASILFQTESCNTYTITVTAAAGEESQSQASTVFVTSNDLTVTLTTDMLYAVVNESALACQAEIQGGIAPYTAAVKIYVDGSVVYEESMADQEAGGIDVAYMPTVIGVHAVSVVVTDAAGMTMEATVELPVAIREPETEADWKSSVSGAARTGDWRKDLVAVARTQVGYQESVRDFIMDEAGKIHGYTRYGAWHGSAYDEWGTLFVSFCLKYANIPTTYFPQAANCGGLASALRNKGLYMTAQDSYEPQAGDLIFLSLGGGSVGIVDSVSGETLRVIMVNTEKTVGSTDYSKHDGSIVGYGSMEAAMRDAGLLEKTGPITLEARWEGDTLGVGDVVTLTALDTEGAAIVWQWMDETGEWKLAQEDGESFAFEVTEENFSWSWRAVYVSDLEKAEDAENAEGDVQ